MVMSDESYSPRLPRPLPSTQITCTRATRRRATSSVAFRGEPLDPDDPLLSFTPVPHVAPRHNSISPARQRAFIAHLAATGIVTQAAKHIGASLEALYRLRNKAGAEGFRAAWHEAVDRGIARIEDGALQRAIEGVEKPIVSGGKLLGWYRVHNEALVMFFLRNRRPERFSEQLTISLKPGDPLYEKIRGEVLMKSNRDDQEVFASIDTFLEGMRTRRLANEAIVAEVQAANEEVAGDEAAGDEERADEASGRARPSIRRLD
jgi:hypothetical protein